MFCVNVKSKEFKEACSRLNIHPSSLEVIVFQYLNNIDAESFPSDEYIMSKLEGKAMTDASESQILLWEKVYSTPKVFSDRASVGAFIKEASKYFSPDSISIHRNNEGQYVANVIKPENRETYEKEIKHILDNAPRNSEGHLLAPNDKPTKLSERQYAQVRTKAFKKWFGDWTKITQNEDGTWNIPNDVSKVIDFETGEPKVVHHGGMTGITTFLNMVDNPNYEKTKHQGYTAKDRVGVYFSKHKDVANNYARQYGKNKEVYNVFLNIKRPKRSSFSESIKNNLLKVLTFGFVSRPTYNLVVKSHLDTLYKGNDGIIVDNGDIYVSFDSNQIKSATDNIGTFSTESDNIRFNIQTEEEIYDVLDFLSKTLKDTNGVSLIHKYEGEYYLSKTAFGGMSSVSVGEAYDKIQTQLEYALTRYNLPINLFNIIQGKASRRIAINSEALKDSISRNETIASLEGSFKSKEEYNKVKSILEFLANKTGLKYEIIPQEKAKELLKSKKIDNVNAFVQGDTCYFIEGRQLNVDIATEEMLHPFVASIRQLNTAAFKSLLRDAQRAFPRLRLEIARNYKGRSIEEIQEELVTQALSRAFREDIKNTPEGHSVKKLIKNFINRIVEIFQSFFGENNSEVITEYKTRVNEILEKEEITAQDLQSTITINELAEIVNSGLKLYSPNIEGTRMNVESSPELETRTQNEEFMENNKALITELENLYDLGLTDTDVKTLGTQLMYWISEHLTVLHNTPGELERVYNIEGKDASTMSRKDIAELVTPKRLMEQCIREFRRPKAGMDWEAVEHLNDIADNARLLLFLSSNTFTTLEGFSIIMPGADFGIMSDIDVTTNEFNGTNEDVQIQEEEGSSIEHWIRASTTITLDERISLDVKSAISKCYRIGKDGKPVIKNGIKERITYEEARNIIVNICNGCLKLSDMITALDKASKDYPWLPQLTDQIRISEDKAVNGARSQLQSAFFRDMYMARNAYSVVKKSGKKYETVIVNENTALKEITNSIITEFTIGSHPLFGEKLGVDSYKELNRLYNTIKDVTEITEENKEEIINSLLGIYNHLGFYTINEDLVKSILTIENVKDITSSLKDLLIKTANGYENQEKTGNKYYPFEYSIGKSAPNSILGNLRAILRIPASRIDNTTAFSVYDNGKMHQSFCTPSYLFKLMTKFQLKDSGKFSEFMDNEYKRYQWFAVDVNGKINYRASWLQEMVDDPNTREILKHKIQLNFNKHNYMRNMTSHEYALSVLTEFFSEKSKLKGRDTAWYRVPMLSNKPSSEFIRFVRYTGPMYKTTIVDALYKVYSQELSRIQTVRLRRQNPENVEYISSFDERGLEFCFLTFLNEHLGTSSELGLLMEQRLNGNTEVIDREERDIKKAIRAWLEQRSSEIIAKWEDNGILEKAEEIANIGDNKIEVKRNIENFIWNDVLASINIQELTITDPALYKDVEDIQKRIAQMHSPGIRPNVDAVDFEGNKVSDGNHRALTFKDPKDFEYVVSNVIDNITVICDRKIAIAEANLKEGKGTAVEVEEAKSFKELLVGEDGLYRQIEVADAQAYSCATSYRKKAFMFGKWSKSAEAVYKKLINNEYVTLSDIKTAFQPLKPFVYSQISKSSGVADAPMQTLKVGIQNKNSEYLLVMAEAMLQNEDTGKPNLLRAISEFMEESAKRFPTRGIDTVQFGSAVKVGKQVRLIDISKAESVEDAKEIMRSFVYPDYVRGTWDTYVPKDPDNPYTEKVDTMPMEDYSIQQEVPAHFRDHQQVEGSQERAIIPSDLPSVDANGNPVTFATGYNIDGTPTGHMSSKEFVREWEETHALNIEESIEMIIQELQLDSLSKKDRNIAIARLLQREILANPNRYGTDLLIACSLDDNYDFRVPLGDPIQSKRVEQLLNSVVKNRINKQTVAGGPIVQVSNFGMSRRLSIVFNGKDGKPLRKRKEGETETEYKQYIADNQAGIAYMECMAPAYTKELFANFADEDGNIDVEAIEKTSPELLKMIGYRIPTEDKYSIAPLKIVGFLPRVAGDGIMLPYDITLINGSDYDVDKMYVMFKEYKVRKREYTKDSNIAKDIQHLVYEKLKEQELKVNGRYNGEALKEKASDITKIFFSSGKKAAKELAIGSSLYKELSNYYRAHRYECVEPDSPRARRNNKIVDMAYAVMTHETTVDKALNPGGFEAQKHSGYLVEAFRKAVVREGITDKEKLLSKYRELEKLSVKELRKLAKTESNLIFIDTQVQFYEQNNAAGALIGIFAVDKVAHAFLSNDGLTYHGIKKGRNFSIGGIQIRNGIDIDSILNRKGQYIGKVLGELVASSVDAIKYPVLNLMNINGTTAATLCTMVRLGIPFETAALFLSSRTIKELLDIQAKENLTKFTTLSNVIDRAIEALGINPNNTTLNNEDLTEEEMIVGLINPTNEIKYKTLRVLSSLLKINSDVKSLSFPTRMNSMAGAVGPLAIDNLILMHKLNKFPKEAFKNSEGQFIDVNYIFDSHPMLKAFYKANDIADRLLKDIPANSMTFKNVIYSGGDIFTETVLSDRKLLSKLSDFYLSYILVSSGVINPKHTMHYINNFPKKYMEIIRSNPELKNNALIDAIKLDMDRKTKKPILKVETTGASITLKERLMGGWTELVRNPNTRDLAIHLFRYNFFRGGVVFNPKTFMGLTTYQVKEAIPGYKEAYTRASIPLNECSHVVDLFIRNNWNEIKLVPHITDKKVIDNILKDIENKDENGIVNTRAYHGLENTDYFKMEIDGNTTLWKIIDRSDETDNIKIIQVEPLGNNGEYLELSKDTITNALTETTESEEVEDSGDIIGDTHIQTSEGTVDSYSENTSSTTTTGEILSEYEEAEYRLEGKKDLSKTKQLEHLVKVSAEQGVTLNKESIEEESKKYC